MLKILYTYHNINKPESHICQLTVTNSYARMTTDNSLRKSA